VSDRRLALDRRDQFLDAIETLEKNFIELVSELESALLDA